MLYQRNYPGTNGHLDHLKDATDDRNELKSMEKNWVDTYPQLGFSKSLQKNLDLMPSSSSSSSGLKRPNHHRHHHHHHSKHQKTSNHHKKINHEKKTDQKRFCRTASALKQAGLLELTLQTAQLVQENEDLQKEIDSLQEQTVQFSKALQEQLEEKLKKAKTNV